MKKVAIIGDNKLGYNEITKIFKSAGSNYKIEIYDDYKKLKRLNYSKFRYNDNYKAIFVGAIPHSVNQKYDSPSIISEMENVDGYPEIIRMYANERLKITNNTIRNGLLKLSEKEDEINGSQMPKMQACI